MVLVSQIINQILKSIMTYQLSVSGTCVPICYSAFILKALGIWQSKIVFVESFCRVEKLSLSGILLYPIADKFIVQWQQLAKFYAGAEYLGDRERFPVVDTSMQ